MLFKNGWAFKTFCFKTDIFSLQTYKKGARKMARFWK